MALYGGLFFVFWIFLARQVIDLKYTEIVTAVFLASFALVFNPGYLSEDYGVWVPAIIYVIRYVGVLIIGILLHFFGPGLSKRSLLAGGLGNLIFAGIIWAAFNFESVCPYPWIKWLTPPSITVYAFAAFGSGMLGVFLGHWAGVGINKLVVKYNKTIQTKCKKFPGKTSLS
jgi:hypothetical protein